MTVTSGEGTNFAVGDYIQIGTEKLYISAISTDTFTVSRGALGSTAAAHSSSDAVVCLPKTGNQAAWTSFARQSLANTDLTISGDRATVNKKLTFPLGSSPTGLVDVTHWGIWEASTPANSGDALLLWGDISNDPDTVEAGDTVEFAADQLYFDGNASGSGSAGLTDEGLARGFTGGGLIQTGEAGALFSDNGAATELSGGNYGRFNFDGATGWSHDTDPAASHPYGEGAELQYGTAEEFPQANAGWTSPARLCIMTAATGGSVLWNHGAAPTGAAALVSGQKFTMAANSIKLKMRLYPNHQGA